MRDVYVVGTSQTPVRRNASTGLRELAATAVGDALSSSGLDIGRVQALFVGNMTGGILDQQLHLGSLIADYGGLVGVEAARVEAGCASGAAALRMAFLMVGSGILDLAVACGVERLAHTDRNTVTQALATASDRVLEGSRGATFLSLNALLMRRYLECYSVSRESFAPFATVPHKNALANPNAALHKAVSPDDYAKSRTVVDPLRLYDASPVCDGAAAVVLASGEASFEWFRKGRPRVAIIGSATATAPVALERRTNVLHFDAVEQSTKRVFSDAGIRHADVDLFELHDAYTIMSVLSLEAAGFAAPGTALQLGCDGRIALSGDIPISTMGGLKGRGHPVGASGVYQVVEACAQLCHEAGANQIPDAEVALVQNIGGTAATVITHALRRVG